MARIKIINGAPAPLTPDEEASRDAEESAWAIKRALHKMSDIRAKRDKLLRETDYLALSDLPPLTTSLVDYRQALRDVPNNIPDKNNPPDVSDIQWPIKPS